jgi:hypothetical protein
MILSAGREQIAVGCRTPSDSPQNIYVETVYVNSCDLPTLREAQPPLRLFSASRYPRRAWEKAQEKGEDYPTWRRSQVDDYRRFQRTCRLHFQGNGI